MYFLRYVDYDKRCDFMEIGEQTEIPRSKIASEQDDFMKNQTETAQNHYKEYKDERNKTMSEAYKKIEEKIDKLPSNDTKIFARQIYTIMKNESLSKKEEYQQAHSLVARTNFETVKNASELIPSKFFADRYGGPVVFTQVHCGGKDAKIHEGSGRERTRPTSHKNSKTKRKKESSVHEPKKKATEQNAPTSASKKVLSNKGNAPNLNNNVTPTPEEKPLNDKEKKILYGQTKADENEYPTMQDAQDGFKNTPTIDTTGAKL
uniref:DUF148 domain-containing protein n=1 Tax=Parastrongyloides trichosuri TaxID=131310 RepID=A0A0N5A2X9_PARTI